MYGTYTRLNIHTWDSDLAVIRAASRKIAAHHRLSTDPAIKASRKAFYRQMLNYHHAQQKLCRTFRI